MTEAIKATEVKKIPLILFSGGLDSTYLLYETLKTSDADILYVKGPQGKDKIDAEMKARDRILTYLENCDELKFRVRRSHVVDGNKDPAADHAFGQIGPWFMGGMDTYETSRHSEVQIAYVSTDGITSQLSTILHAWESLAAAYKLGLVPLKFPLQLYGKYDILLRIPYDLYMRTWVCELPVAEVDYGINVTECGRCPACITRKVEEYRYELKEGRNYHAKSQNITKMLEALTEDPSIDTSVTGGIDKYDVDIDVPETIDSLIIEPYEHLIHERIVCAANKYPDGEIVLGVRHFDSFMHKSIDRKENGPDTANDVIQGFVDGTGKFLTREEAHVRAIQHKQILRRVGGDQTRLFSENIC